GYRDRHRGHPAFLSDPLVKWNGGKSAAERRHVSPSAGGLVRSLSDRRLCGGSDVPGILPERVYGPVYAPCVGADYLDPVWVDAFPGSLLRLAGTGKYYVSRRADRADLLHP